MPLEDCKLIDLPKIADARGNLSFVEGGRHIPFDIRRIYYLYDVPAGESRGGHGHKALTQLMIAMSGSFDVTLDDGSNRKTFNLSRPFVGLFVCPMMWRTLKNFSTGSVCAVLASDLYREDDYYRTYEAFLNDARKDKP